MLAAKCINVYIQRGVPSRTLLGHSKLLASGNLSGWGLYSGQPLRKGDYIGEYVGEVVTSEEGERRGVVYDKRNMSYLFDLNSCKFGPMIRDEHEANVRSSNAGQYTGWE